MSLPFRLLVISDRSLMGPDPVARVLELARAGVPGWALQWREPSATPRDLYRDLLQIAVERTSPLSVFVNDRVDIALALGLSVHLKESSLPTRVARAMLPAGTMVGRSVHSIESAVTAMEEGADYLLFGPIFDTPSKRPFGAPQGLDALQSVVERASIPVLAVGGIDVSNASECMAAGAAGVAVIRAVWDAPDPLRAVRTLLDAIPSA